MFLKMTCMFICKYIVASVVFWYLNVVYLHVSV